MDYNTKKFGFDRGAGGGEAGGDETAEPGKESPNPQKCKGKHRINCCCKIPIR